MIRFPLLLAAAAATVSSASGASSGAFLDKSVTTYTPAKSEPVPASYSKSMAPVTVSSKGVPVVVSSKMAQPVAFLEAEDCREVPVEVDSICRREVKGKQTEECPEEVCEEVKVDVPSTCYKSKTALEPYPCKQKEECTMVEKECMRLVTEEEEYDCSEEKCEKKPQYVPKTCTRMETRNAPSTCTEYKTEEVCDKDCTEQVQELYPCPMEKGQPIQKPVATRPQCSVVEVEVDATCMRKERQQVPCEPVAVVTSVVEPVVLAPPEKKRKEKTKERKLNAEKHGSEKSGKKDKTPEPAVASYVAPICTKEVAVPYACKQKQQQQQCVDIPMCSRLVKKQRQQCLCEKVRVPYQVPCTQPQQVEVQYECGKEEKQKVCTRTPKTCTRKVQRQQPFNCSEKVCTPTQGTCYKKVKASEPYTCTKQQKQQQCRQVMKKCVRDTVTYEEYKCKETVMKTMCRRDTPAPAVYVEEPKKHKKHKKA